jgi:hypothetical protein
MKRAGKRTVHPERVVFGGLVRVLSGFAGALLGWAGGLQGWAGGLPVSF